MKSLIAVAVLAAGCIVAAAPAASADPVEQASCVGVYSVIDAKGQNRDDVAHIFKEIADDQAFPPGSILVETPRPCTG